MYGEQSRFSVQGIKNRLYKKQIYSTIYQTFYRVHESVLNAGEKETGITIHLLNEKYDEGKIKFQKTCAIDSSDSAEDISRKVQKLEHEWYPKIIEGILTS